MLDDRKQFLNLVGVALFATSFCLILVTAWGPTFGHIGESSWSIHQEFHAFREIFMVTFFGLAGLYLCLGPLRRGEEKTLGMVLFLCLGLVMGFFVGLPVTGIGKPGVEPLINHGLQLVAMIAGYILCRLSFAQ